MKILFTGGSSFTGFWFIRELAAAGHSVTAVFRRQTEEYPDVTRRNRVILASATSRPVYGCCFGDERFLALINEGGWDLLCHHAADVTNYKSPNFDTVAALRNNTYNLSAVAPSRVERVPAPKDCRISLRTAYPRLLLVGHSRTTVSELVLGSVSSSSPIHSALLKSLGSRRT
jgi:nucleoside-diphosphate-sugar epimerase